MKFKGLLLLCLLGSLLIISGGCAMLQSGAMSSARDSISKGKYAAALERLSDAENYSEPTPSLNAEITYLKGVCYEKLRKPEDAKAMFNRAVEKFPASEYGKHAKKKLEEAEAHAQRMQVLMETARQEKLKQEQVAAQEKLKQEQIATQEKLKVEARLSRERQKAEQGDATAQFNLGNAYSLGRGVAQDYIEAVKWYRLAANQRHAKAQLMLGYAYFLGRGIAKDYTEAVKWWHLAAEQGDATAQYNLGNAYGNGRGIAQDSKEAEKWWRLAAEQGNAEAQSNLTARAKKLPPPADVLTLRIYSETGQLISEKTYPGGR